MSHAPTSLVRGSAQKHVRLHALENVASGKNSSKFFIHALLLLLMLVSPGLASAPKDKAGMRSPLAPREALKHFRIAPGLRVELVACEPQIESPVAMAFDEDGKLWVVEMRDYPNGPKRGEKPAGRIRILEDRDGDGFFEHSTVFADNLLFANGLLPWRGGALVTAAPAIMHLEREPDGKAGKRSVLFEGFAAQNPQLRVSHPNLGIDNWIYVANGLRGGLVKAGKDPAAKPINLAGMDFRFDLIHDRYEAISGMGQYGNTFDDWGRRFVCDNRHHLRHVVIESRYLQRNPYLAAPAVVEDISILDDGPLGSGGKIYPISSNWTTSSLHEGRFTAACSVYIYRGFALPQEYYGSAFTCDPTGNLVHREILEPHGATFRSHPDRKGVEFLASPDDWFRPVFLNTGPDGALYVVDMYRAVIEHPEWMPPELQKRPDLNLGKDRGRIWRIVPDAPRFAAQEPRQWSKASPEQLVGLLRPSGWLALTGQRLLLERGEPLPVAALRNQVENAEASAPAALARVRAAWLLHHFDRLDDALILRLLQDKHPRAREHGVLLAESRLAKLPALRAAVLKLADDPDARVRFQTALSLGEWNNPAIIEPLARIAVAGAEDPWTRLAVASAVPNRAGALLSKLLHTPALFDKTTPARLNLIQEILTLIGARLDAAEVDSALSALSRVGTKDRLTWQLAGLNGLTEGMGRRGVQLGTFIKSLPSLKTAADPAKAEIAVWLDTLLARTANIAADPKHAVPERISAIRMLAHAPWSVAEPKLSLLMDDPIQDIRIAAVRSLAAHNRPEVSRILMKSWRSYTPPVRREVLDAMLRQPARVSILLDEVEARHVKPGDIESGATRRLLGYGDANLRARARKLLQDNLPADRKLVLARYQEALKLPGDPKQGREIFKKNCATCHRVAGIGVDVGPDISDTRTKTAAALLVDILNPNQAIDNNAMAYLLVTKSGKSMTGLIAAETASSITLRRAEGQNDTVLRQDIEELQSTGISLMPEGLEKSIAIKEMADLLSFLKNWRYLDGKVPVGTGSVVRSPWSVATDHGLRTTDSPANARKPLVVDLWPGKAPDEPGNIGAEYVRMSPKLTKKQVEVTEPTRLVTNVTKPTITVYRPAKEKDTGTAVLICPGGGYWNLYWQLEGEEVAAWLNSLGMTGIILKYRVPRRPDDIKGEPARRPLQDAQRAVRLVRSKAKEWGIDPKKIGMIGFSAGGHLAIATATSFAKRTYEPIDDIDRLSSRPDFAVAAYSGYLKAKDKDVLSPGLHVPSGTPPVFLVHGGEDIVSDPAHSVVMYLALKRAGVPAELHIYANTAHDFAVRAGDEPYSTWTQSCAAWLRQQGMLRGAP